RRKPFLLPDRFFEKIEPFETTIQPFDLMSRRHPLSSTRAVFKNLLREQTVLTALVTCRHQPAGNFLEARLLLLLGDLAGLLRSLLHCALRLLCLLSFLGHVAL